MSEDLQILSLETNTSDFSVNRYGQQQQVQPRTIRRESHWEVEAPRAQLDGADNDIARATSGSCYVIFSVFTSNLPIGQIPQDKDKKSGRTPTSDPASGTKSSQKVRVRMHVLNI
jgi:hypothetical protein